MKMTTTVDIKFTKFDNRPWGFRLAGGSDFPQPLTVIRVSEESLAECMGLQVGDIVIRLNDQPVYEMTHGQAHEALCLAGNNFVLTVRRAEDPKKLIEGIQGEKIEPYMLPLEEILLKERETTPDEVPQIQDECVPYVIQETECVEVTVEEYPEKPRDENSEVIPNKHLSEDEIAQLILEEEEVLNDKGVLGVNFNKIRPRVPLLKESKVLQELQKETDLISDKPGELNLKSTFLKKPDRPVPSIKSNSPDKSQESSEQYRVVIKKQPKKSVTERLLEKGLIDAGKIKTPEPVSSEVINLTVEIPLPKTNNNNNNNPIIKPKTIPEKDENLKVNNLAEIEIKSNKMASPTLSTRPRGRLCRRGKYGSKCLVKAIESLKPSTKTTSSSGLSSKIIRSRPRFPIKGHYFEAVVRDSLISTRLMLLASIAYAMKDTYNTEILHRGSSRRNSRRMSYRRDSIMESKLAALAEFAAQSGPYYFVKDGCKAGKRRISVMSMAVAKKVNNAFGSDTIKVLTCALVPCASALAFFLYNYSKPYNYY